MDLVKKILNKLNGLYFPQEYLCLAQESFQQPAHVYLVYGNRIIKDITNEHLFIGYCPLVFAFNNIEPLKTIHLVFSQEVFHPNEKFEKKDAIALLQLKKIEQLQPDDKTISYYEGSNGKHYLQSIFPQLMSRINNRLYNKKPGNVFLHDNLYKQVQVAYAVPRIISLITVSDGQHFNLFPTDLHGQPDEIHYIISLRTGGKAAAQVATARKLVISRMHCDAYKTVYALGKNHMQALRTREELPFGDLLSANYQLPLPQNILSYQELQLQHSFEHGIHTIFLFDILNSQPINPQPATLSHIHNSYASWRYKNGLPGNYLLR